jgi:ABC-2 type transport system ATP-binding protein
MARAPALLAALLVVGLPAAVLALPARAGAWSQQDVTIPGAGGIALAATVFVPAGDGPFPVVLRTHGWAGNRETSADPNGTIARLLDDGIAVVTWDSRGFGASGGTVELDSPEHEGRDVSAILDWLSTSAPFPVRMDGPADPRAGMSGGSYAGAIQLLAAAIDPRIDAISPEITWNDLADSLAPNGVLKLGWTALLYASGEAAGYLGTVPPDTGHLHPNTEGVDLALTQWLAEGAAMNAFPPDVAHALAHRSPATFLPFARMPPTLLVQGERDTLFTPQEALKNLRALQAKGVPAQLLLHGGGHGYPTPDADFVRARVAAWLDFWLQGRGSLPAQPVTVYQDWDQAWAALPDWPARLDAPLHLAPPAALPAEPGLGAVLQGCLCAQAAPGQVVLVNTVAPSSYREVPDFNTQVPVPPTDAPAGSALFEEPALGEERATVGTPWLHLVVTAPPDAELFVKVTDTDASGAVSLVGNQVTPLRMPGALGGPTLTQAFDVPLVSVVHAFGAGHHRGVSISTTDDAYSPSRVPGPVVLDAGASGVRFPS